MRSCEYLQGLVQFYVLFKDQIGWWTSKYLLYECKRNTVTTCYLEHFTSSSIGTSRQHDKVNLTNVTCSFVSQLLSNETHRLSEWNVVIYPLERETKAYTATCLHTKAPTVIKTQSAAMTNRKRERIPPYPHSCCVKSG